jgi:hypothetical protein
VGVLGGAFSDIERRWTVFISVAKIDLNGWSNAVLMYSNITILYRELILMI